jgi:UDP-N-acetylglucosamine 2-epimerase (non-hydrolysing)
MLLNRKIHLIAAARPNFMKIAPLYHALAKEDWAEPAIVHTGQHYDKNMSDTFFEDLGLPRPHYHLGVGSGSHAEQTGKVMVEYEKLVMSVQPDMVVVVGDVNSTLACTLATIKVVYDHTQPKHLDLNRPVIAHLEAGLRSFDRSMPEEVNRIATDVLADVLWTPSDDGDENLLRESVNPKAIERVGNIMIDSLEMMRDRIEAANVPLEFGLSRGDYVVLTLHRPANVDRKEILERLCRMIIWVAQKMPIVFPVHPRTRKNLDAYGLLSTLENNTRIKVLCPQSYIRFMSLVFNCGVVITDSGGIQEETTYLGIPCLTLRNNTERPITVTQGSNQLCTLDNIEEKFAAIIADNPGRNALPQYWDGKTASRVVASIKTVLDVSKQL